MYWIGFSKVYRPTKHIYFSGPEVLFKTCVAMKFVDDDDDYRSYWGQVFTGQMT